MQRRAMSGLLHAALVAAVLATAAALARRVERAGFHGQENGVCSVPSSQQVECGFRGVQRWECLRANCCWRERDDAGGDERALQAAGQQTQCYHRVSVATLEDRMRVIEQVGFSEAHVWRVYNPKGLSPARFVVEFAAGSDIDMLVKCCDSSGGASPTCPDFDNYDFWSRDLPRRSPFRFDVYDHDAASCGEWGIMIHGVGDGNQSYTIYSEVDRDPSVTEMANHAVYSGSMIRDDWRFYRFHVRRANNVHIPLQLTKLANVSLYARWDHLPNWLPGAHDAETRIVDRTGAMCLRLDFDIPRTGMLYLGFNTTSISAEYQIQALQSNRGACVIRK